MITLKQNLEDAILFALMDKGYSQADSHKISKDIAPTMDKEVRRLFKFFLKGYSEVKKDPEIKKVVNEFIKLSVDRKVKIE